MSFDPKRPITWAPSHQHMRALVCGGKTVQKKEAGVGGIENVKTETVGGVTLGDGPFEHFMLIPTKHPTTECTEKNCPFEDELTEKGEVRKVRRHQVTCEKVFSASGSKEVVSLKLSGKDGEEIWTTPMAGKMFVNVE